MKKIIVLAMVLAVVAALATPMAALATTTTPVTVTGVVGQTPTPSITPTPIYPGATSISGTSVANAHITLTVNGSTQYTAIASAGGAWTVSPISPALAASNTISVIAQLDPDVNSSPATATVAASAIITFTVPSGFAWTGTFTQGTNTGTAATAGSVVIGGG
jgi:hypothetical protein